MTFMLDTRKLLPGSEIAAPTDLLGNRLTAVKQHPSTLSYP